jgi:hypothetical protein
MSLEPESGLPDGTYIFKPNIPIWVNFGGYCNGRCWSFYSHVVCFTATWYIYCGHFVYFSTLHLEKSGNPDHNHNVKKLVTFQASIHTAKDKLNLEIKII